MMSRNRLYEKVRLIFEDDLHENSIISIFGFRNLLSKLNMSYVSYRANVGTR
jgi:hypothetical protein